MCAKTVDCFFCFYVFCWDVIWWFDSLVASLVVRGRMEDTVFVHLYVTYTCVCTYAPNLYALTISVCH